MTLGPDEDHRFPVPSSLFPAVTGLTGLEPATSGVTDRHSNQAELQPQRTTNVCNLPNHLLHIRSGDSPAPNATHSPNGNRTRLSTLKGSRPNR